MSEGEPTIDPEHLAECEELKELVTQSMSKELPSHQIQVDVIPRILRNNQMGSKISVTIQPSTAPFPIAALTPGLGLLRNILDQSSFPTVSSFLQECDRSHEVVVAGVGRKVLLSQ